MRLGQLARKLELRPNEIVEFLTSKEISIDNSSNTRLDDEHVMLIVKHFAPGKDLLIQEETISREEEKISVVEIQPVTIVDIPVIAAEILPVEVIDSTPALRELSEVIKAPKIELTGLKVVGKIDLPEPKKKEDTTTSGEEIDSDKSVEQKLEKSSKGEDRRTYRKENPDERRPRKNPIAIQREREASDIDKKKQIRAAQAKEQRTNNYLKKVKPATPTKAIKIISEPLEALSDNAESKPTTLFGRLLKWLKQS